MPETYKVVDNFLPSDAFDELKSCLMSWSFPWFRQAQTTYSEKPTTQPSESTDKAGDYNFTHVFCSEGQSTSEHFHLLAKSLIDYIVSDKDISDSDWKIESLLRAKANLYTRSENLIEHPQHKDFSYPHKGAILYINDNNGFTSIENSDKIESKSNRLLMFDSSKFHNSTNCTDRNCRINININYL